MKKTPTEVTPARALVRLETLCARAEHSTGEMYAKLRCWHIVGVEADKIVSSLKERRYVDDARFARAYINDKTKVARWGRRKIESGLYAKGIEHETMREAMAEIDEEVYCRNLEDIIMAKIKAAPALTESYEGRTKLFRHVVSRGYEPALAAETLRRILTEQRG